MKKQMKKQKKHNEKKHQLKYTKNADEKQMKTDKKQKPVSVNKFKQSEKRKKSPKCSTSCDKNSQK